jgi:hypothetical protein
VCRALNSRKRRFPARAVASADAHAAAIAKSEGKAAVVKYLSNFSVATADALVDEWVAFFPELFVKYRDGLVVSLPAPPPAGPQDLPQAPSCNSPGYDEKWYTRVVDDAGEHYLLPQGGGGEDLMVRRDEQRKLELLTRN